MPHPRLRLALALTAVGCVLAGILAVAVITSRRDERAIMREELINRAADVLYPAALQQVAESDTANPGADPSDLLWPVLASATQKGMLGVTIFNSDGDALQSVPNTLLLPEIPAADLPQLLASQPISQYHPKFEIERYFSGSAGAPPRPVLEVLLPLNGRDPSRVIGFAQYYIDAEATGLTNELAQVDHQINRQMERTLGLGILLIALILGLTYAGLARAQRLIEERTERLVRANFELTLAAKVSALGQITSDLIHGLQGPVAGLRAVTAGAARTGNAEEDWRSAAHYADRMQTMIQETVTLLGDIGGGLAYELPGTEIADTIRRRNEPAARERAVSLAVEAEPKLRFDSRRGSLICLIATNLAQNAIAATPPGKHVAVSLRQEAAGTILTVSDEGPGIPPEARERLFEPGRSGRPGGTGLGLAISRLLARQLGGELALQATGPDGTTFRLTVPAWDSS